MNISNKILCRRAMQWVVIALKIARAPRFLELPQKRISILEMKWMN
jgi:hypothetical protein